jgi:hypothetical protein
MTNEDPISTVQTHLNAIKTRWDISGEIGIPDIQWLITKVEQSIRLARAIHTFKASADELIKEQQIEIFNKDIEIFNLTNQIDPRQEKSND